MIEEQCWVSALAQELLDFHYKTSLEILQQKTSIHEMLSFPDFTYAVVKVQLNIRA